MWNEKRTTSLIDIRRFLRSHATEPAPWEKPKRVVDHLYRTLRGKRGDDRFWSDLRKLTRDLEDHRFDPDALRGTTAIKDATVDNLIEDLRTSLSGTEENSSAARWAAGAVAGSALLGFVFLGYSIGCTGSDDDDDSGSSTTQTDDDVDDDDDNDTGSTDDCDEAKDAGVTGEDADVYCDLVEIVMAADIPASYKTDFLECLPTMSASYRESLLETFQTMEDEALVDYLTDMIEVGICSDDPWTDDDH